MTHRKRTREDGFVVSQAALGEPLQFEPALGTAELDNLINAYIPGPEPVSQKRARVTIDFLNTVDASSLPGPVSRLYHVASPVRAAGQPMAWSPTSSSSSTSAKRPRTEINNNRVKRHPGFSIMTKDGVDITDYASRGPKTKEQRDHAALMRKIGSCAACKRKKQKCDPSHHKSPDSAAQAPTSKSNRSSSSSRPSISPQTAIAESFSPLVSRASSSRLVAHTGERFSPLATPKPVLSPSDFVEYTSLDNLGIDPSGVIDPELVARWDATFPGLDYPLYPEADPWDATPFQLQHILGPEYGKRDNIADAALAAAESGTKQSAQSTSDPPSDYDWFDFSTFADTSVSSQLVQSIESYNPQDYHDYQWGDLTVAPDFNTEDPSYAPRIASRRETIHALKSLQDLLDDPQPPESLYLARDKQGATYLDNARGSHSLIDASGLDSLEQSGVIHRSPTYEIGLPRFQGPEILEWHDQGRNLSTSPSAYYDRADKLPYYEAKSMISANKITEQLGSDQVGKQLSRSFTASKSSKYPIEGFAGCQEIPSATTFTTVSSQPVCLGYEMISNTAEKRESGPLSDPLPLGGIGIGDVVRCAKFSYEIYQKSQKQGKLFVNLGAEVRAVGQALLDIEPLVRTNEINSVIHRINNDLEHLQNLLDNVSKCNMQPISVRAEVFSSKFLIHNQTLRLMSESIKLSTYVDRGVLDLNYQVRQGVCKQGLDGARHLNNLSVGDNPAYEALSYVWETKPRSQEWPALSRTVSDEDAKLRGFSDFETENQRANYRPQRTKAEAKTKILDFLLLITTFFVVLVLGGMKSSSQSLSVSGNSLLSTRSYQNSILPSNSHSWSVAEDSYRSSNDRPASVQENGEISFVLYRSSGISKAHFWISPVCKADVAVTTASTGTLISSQRSFISTTQSKQQTTWVLSKPTIEATTTSKAPIPEIRREITILDADPCIASSYHTSSLSLRPRFAWLSATLLRILDSIERELGMLLDWSTSSTM